MTIFCSPYNGVFDTSVEGAIYVVDACPDVVSTQQSAVPCTSTGALAATLRHCFVIGFVDTGRRTDEADGSLQERTLLKSKSGKEQCYVSMYRTDQPQLMPPKREERERERQQQTDNGREVEPAP